MMVLFRLIALVTLFFPGLPVLANHPDHALLTRYPGSQMATKDVKSYNEYALVVGIGKGIALDTQKIQGKVTRMRYRNPKDRSVFEIFANYEMALKNAGLEIIFQCDGKACGPTYSSTGWSQTAGFTVKSGADSRYLAGSMSTEDGQQVYIAVMVGNRQHQIDIIEIADMQENLVTVDASSLASGLEKHGAVSIYGIYFDSGKSEIKAESNAVLNVIGELLTQNPKLNLFVVGHTDSDGSFDFNLQLSKDRAQAIVEHLVNHNKIQKNRLKPYGVGPLSPKASNSNESGKQKNRRVELVKID